MELQAVEFYTIPASLQPCWERYRHTVKPGVIVIVHRERNKRGCKTCKHRYKSIPVYHKLSMYHFDLIIIQEEIFFNYLK